MAFLFSRTAAPPPAETTGLEMVAVAKRLVAERAARMTAATTFIPTVLKDVLILVERQLAVDPWNLVVVISMDQVVNDVTLSSRPTFLAICGTTKKELARGEKRALLHAVRDAAKGQDYTVSIDYAEGTATLDFTRAEQDAEERRSQKAKWRGGDSIVRVLHSSQDSSSREKLTEEPVILK